MKKFHGYFFLIFLIVLTAYASCIRTECKNTHTIFSEFDPTSETYQRELAKQLRNNDLDELSYWFDRYIELEDGRTYMLVDVQGGEICAKAMVLVRDWQKKEGIQMHKGGGYRGAGLIGLEVEVEKQGASEIFVYKDIDFIRD